MSWKKKKNQAKAQDTITEDESSFAKDTMTNSKFDANDIPEKAYEVKPVYVPSMPR